MQVAYDGPDLSMRVLVKGGWPILLDYGLQSDAPARLTLVVNRNGLPIELPPADRNQVSIVLPAYFGREVQVARLNISAVTRGGRKTASLSGDRAEFVSVGARLDSGLPESDFTDLLQTPFQRRPPPRQDRQADFQLFGLAMGQKGVQALMRVKQQETELAMSGAAQRLESGYEPLAFFAPVPQSGTSLQIIAPLPTTLRAKQKPENHIEFSYTSREDFSEGRWEWWRVTGLHWEKVWQQGTGGGISRNQTKSEKWNGIITSHKVVSTGSHALQLTAWQKAGSNRDWVVARAPSRLTVIE